MSTRKSSADVPRRSLLKLAPLAGAAAVLPRAAGASAVPEEVPKTDGRQPMLADNEHTRTYYRLARR